MIARLREHRTLLMAAVLVGLVLRLASTSLSYQSPPLSAGAVPVLTHGVLGRASSGLTPPTPQTPDLIVRSIGLVVLAIALALILAMLGRWPAARVRGHAIALAGLAALHPAALIAGGTGSAAAFVSLGMVLAVLVLRAAHEGRLGRVTAIASLVAIALFTMPPVDGLLVVGLMGAVVLLRPHERDEYRAPVATRWALVLGIAYVFRAPLLDTARRVARPLAPFIPQLASTLSASLTSWGAVARGLLGLTDITLRLPSPWVLAAPAVGAFTLAVVLAAREAATAALGTLRALRNTPSGVALKRTGWGSIGLLFAASAPAAVLTAPMLNATGIQPKADALTTAAAPWLAALGLAGLVLVALRSGAAAAAWRELRQRWRSVDALSMAVVVGAAYLGLVRTPSGSAGWAWTGGVVGIALVGGVLAHRIGRRAETLFLRLAALLMAFQTVMFLWLPVSPAAQNAWNAVQLGSSIAVPVVVTEIPMANTVVTAAALAMTAVLVLVVFVDTAGGDSYSQDAEAQMAPRPD